MKNPLKAIHKILRENKKTLAVAESCTGGSLSGILTKNPGSSAYFLLGLVTYQNQTKHAFLKIPLTRINRYGAVSRFTAVAMAANIRRIAKSDFGLGVTGIAGPEKIEKHHPLGTVFVAVADKRKTFCKKFKFSGSRSTVRRKASAAALTLLAELICASLSE